MVSNKKEEPAYYAIIPANVRYDKTLSPNAKLLYGELTALCKNKEGYCWASNKYFADLYGVQKSSITNWVRSLVEGGYITVEFVYANTGGKPFIETRKIFLTGLGKIPSKLDKPPLPESAIKGAEKNEEDCGQITEQGCQLIDQGVVKKAEREYYKLILHLLLLLKAPKNLKNHLQKQKYNLLMKITMKVPVKILQN